MLFSKKLLSKDAYFTFLQNSLKATGLAVMLSGGVVAAGGILLPTDSVWAGDVESSDSMKEKTEKTKDRTDVPRSQMELSRNAEELVDEAYYTIRKVLETKHNADMALADLKKARALIIAPNVVKGAFIFGAEGGSAVIVARADNGEWSYPGFFKLGSASFGLQVGAQSSELLVIVKTGNGLVNILDDSVVVGAGLSAAMGDRGEGLSGKSTLDTHGGDLVSYSVNSGGFIGASLEGVGIWEDTEANEAFYEAGANSKDIILNGKYNNPHADRLRNYLATFPMDPLTK